MDPVPTPTRTARFLTSRTASTLAAVAILAGATSLLARGEEAPEPNVVEPVRRVLVAPVTQSGGQSEHRSYGTTRAANRSVASFTVGGRLTARPVEVGTLVKKGQVLARVDTRPLVNNALTAQASLAELDARLAQRRRDRSRAEALWADNALAKSDMENARSGFQALEAARRATRAQLSEAKRLVGEGTLRSPFEGQVIEVHLEPGEYAGPGVPVVTLSGEGAIEVEVEVPESVVLKLSPGVSVQVSLPMMGREVSGVVDSVGRAAGMRGGLFPVLVRLDADEGVRPGMTAELSLQVDDSAGTTVPVASVLDPSGRRPAVFRLDGDRVVQVPVEVGDLDGDRVRVRGKLKDGDRVVVGGHAFLIDGDRVEVN